MNYLIALLVWLASLAAVGYWQRHDGGNAVRVEDQQRGNKELTDANAEIRRLGDKARDAERKWATDLTGVSTEYERRLTNANDQKNRDIAAAVAGAIKLRDPGAGRDQADGGSAGATPPATGRCDGAPPGELSRPASAFLLGLVDEADTVAEQLTACQDVLTAERK